MTDQILTLLIAERDKLQAAINALGGSPVKRRGRPPKNPYGDPSMPEWVKPKSQQTTEDTPAKPKRKKRTAAQRKAQAARMKAYWAERKKAKK